MALSVEQVREWFRDNGITITRWANDHGFSPGLVYQVVQGKRKVGFPDPSSRPYGRSELP
ncbi:MAG: DNA-binding protein [Zoogloeaceae bacterium]|nr:DNA-binding protein [Zoogloeaceae bacterium]